MSDEDRERRIARAMWAVAIGMIERRDPDARPLVRAALERPCAETIWPLLDAGRGKQWRPALVDVLTHMGVVAAEHILGDQP